MKKRKAIKMIGVFMTAIMVMTSMMALPAFAKTENIKVLELAKETFDSQSMDATFTADSSAGNYIGASYVPDSDGGYKMQLQVTGTHSNIYHQPRFYKTTTQYKEGMFSVKYTPVYTNGADNYGGRVYFRAISRENYKYMIQLNPGQIRLMRDANAWQVSDLQVASYTFNNGTEYDIRVSFKTIDDTNDIKIWIDDVLVIDYSGEISGVENTNGYKNGTNTPIALGVHGAVDDAATEGVDESTRVLFDDFMILDNLTDRTFNGKTEFSTTSNNGPYWYYYSRKDGELQLLDEYRTGAASNDWELTGWHQADNGTVDDHHVAVGVETMRPGSQDGVEAVKVFQAPYNGVITIGAETLALSGGNASGTGQVQIIKNQEVVWPKATDTDWIYTGSDGTAAYNGYAAVTTTEKEFTPIQVRVSHGDKIGFVVKGDGFGGNGWSKITKWIPTIQYTSVESMGMNAVISDGTTEYAGLSALKASVDGAEKDVKLNVKVYCDAAMDEHATYRVLAGIYNSEGILIDAGLSEEKSAMIDGESHSHTLTVGDTADIANGSYVKLYLWNCDAGNTPYMDAITIK